jgi:hypothetical protein
MNATERLEAARRQTLARIGTVSERVLSRTTPIFMTDDGPVMRFWPSSALGKQLLVRKKDSILLITDGISDPWDTELHADAPKWTFGFEMALEVPLAHVGDASDEGIAGSWMTTLLWAATDWVTAERFDIKSRLIEFDCVTIAIPPVRGLEKLVGSNGYMGGLLGIPYAGEMLCAQAVLAPEPHEPADAVWLLPLKLMTADEYDWAVGVPDGSRTKALADAFLKIPSRHLSWPDRPSVLPRILNPR